jgi:hypothetical protein
LEVLKTTTNTNTNIYHPNTANEAMLLKFLRKLYSRADIPLVKLVWEKYYNTGKLPGQQRKGSFSWRDIVKLLAKYKGMVSVSVADGTSVLFWKDHWNDITPALAFPELFSFAKNENITFRLAVSSDDFTSNLNLPLSVEAHQQLLLLQDIISRREIFGGNDLWKYSWGTSHFSTAKAYRVLKVGPSAHPVYQWIWKSKCQMKHKVFFWLILKDRVSTRDLLRRREMNLDSYSSDMCILQRPETGVHLFLRCNFSKACWSSLGVSWHLLCLHEVGHSYFQANQREFGSPFLHGDHYLNAMEHLAYQE